MSFSEDLSDSFSTLFADSSLRLVQPQLCISAQLPEQRHAEIVVRRVLRKKATSLDPVQQRVHQAAAVIRTAFVGTESIRREASGVYPLARATSSSSPGRTSISARLARRILHRISSRIFRRG